ncbi:MAG: NAD(+)/NADH kinase [Mariprofundales bacterium]
MIHIIAISVRPDTKKAVDLALELAQWLRDKNITVLLAPETGCQTACTWNEIIAKAKLLIVLGGDGSVLHAARRLVGKKIPLLGINLGRLGFLTESPLGIAGDVYDIVAEVLAGNYRIERHSTLSAHSLRAGSTLRKGLAFNDVVLQRNHHPRMIEFEMRIDDQFVFRLRADGLVLATPAGSTAYALSAGGAIVHPSCDGISVVPICPHTLSNRPIIVPANQCITLHLTESPAAAALNLDGQVHQELEQGDEVCIERGGIVLLAYLNSRNYYQVLRSKLNWAGRPADNQVTNS